MADGGLVNLVLNVFDQVLDGRDALLHFHDQAAHILDAFILRQGITRPALLVVGLEGDPFLPDPVFGQALHLGQFVDAPLQLGVELGVGILGTGGFAQGFLQGQNLGVKGLGRDLDVVELFLPLLVRAVAVDLGDGLLLDEGDLGRLALRFGQRQLPDAALDILVTVQSQVGAGADLVDPFAQCSELTL